MKKIYVILAVASLFIGTSYSFSEACAFDTDCSPGSKCIKISGSIYGVCGGGSRPGNTYDRKPVRSSLDANKTYGDTCSFDTECGPGSKCVKSFGSIKGVCVKR